MQDPVYTTSVGEISEIADPDWLVTFMEALTSLQYVSVQRRQGYEQGEYKQYQGWEVVESGIGTRYYFVCYYVIHDLTLFCHRATRVWGGAGPWVWSAWCL